MSDELKEIINELEIVARKHTIAVCEDGSKIETMPASVVDELRLNNYSSKLLLDYITNLQTIEREYSSLLSENAELKQEINFLEEMIGTYYMPEIARLNNIINELEKTTENRLMAVPDDVLDDEIEEIKRTTKIAVYQVVLGDLYKLKELKENNNAKD